MNYSKDSLHQVKSSCGPVSAGAPPSKPEGAKDETKPVAPAPKA